MRLSAYEAAEPMRGVHRKGPRITQHAASLNGPPQHAGVPFDTLLVISDTARHIRRTSHVHRRPANWGAFACFAMA